MLLSSILGPGSIFLMIIGGLSISFNIDTSVAFFFVAFPVAFFWIDCLIDSPKNQVFFIYYFIF